MNRWCLMLYHAGIAWVSTGLPYKRAIHRTPCLLSSISFMKCAIFCHRSHTLKLGGGNDPEWVVITGSLRVYHIRERK